MGEVLLSDVGSLGVGSLGVGSLDVLFLDGLLNVEAEVHDVSVLYHIFFSFDAEFAVVSGGGF